MIDMSTGKADHKWESTFCPSARRWICQHATGASFLVDEAEAEDAEGSVNLTRLLNRKALVALAPLNGCHA